MELDAGRNSCCAELKFVVRHVAWGQTFHSMFSSALLNANVWEEMFDDEASTMSVAKKVALSREGYGRGRRELPLQSTTTVRQHAATGVNQFQSSMPRQ